MRFAMRLDPWWQPLLLLLGATPGNSYVALEGDAVRVRFGFFQYLLPCERIVGARRAPGNWGYGIGVHGNPFSWLVVNGSLAGLVELQLVPPVRTWVLFIPVRCSRLYVSLEQPDAFLQALGQGLAPPAR